MTPTRAVTYVPLDDIRPADRNPKAHDHRVLRSSFERFGFVEPIIRDDRTGRLVAGHGRLDELRQARARDPELAPDGVSVDDDGIWHVPIITGWASSDDREAQAYVIAANRAVELGGWDDDVLADALIELSEHDHGLDGTGYSLDEALAKLSEQLGNLDVDDIDVSPQLAGFTYRVVVDCDDEQHQAEILDRLTEQGLSVRAVVN